MIKQKLPSQRWLLYVLAVAKVLALVVFSFGFFLTRTQLLETSICEDFFGADPNRLRIPFVSADSQTGCWLEPGVDKLVLFVVDGARFDFATAFPHGEKNAFLSDRPPLQAINEILGDDCEIAELFRFVADSPTTTQQRLKGILTGGLPTFFDISKSFGAVKLVEDNIIAQAAAAGRRVSFSGDDTWVDLFHPAHFAAGMDPKPSYNVKDLDTVDNNVRKHLMSALDEPGEWDILICHFLGVDHAGHTYGVDSPAMARKLEETNADIKAAASMIAADEAFDRTLFIVMRDHGMTTDGDHGGSTQDETDTFIFVHRPRAAKLNQSQTLRNTSSRFHQSSDFLSVAQIDFAPTISAILDLPIPFSNLGTVQQRIYEIASPRKENWNHSRYCDTEFCASDMDEQYLISLRGTATQVWRYIDEYTAKAGNPFASNEWASLLQLRSLASSESGVQRDDIENIKHFLHTAAAITREKWVQFCLWKMAVGILLLFCPFVMSITVYAHSRRSLFFCVMQWLKYLDTRRCRVILFKLFWRAQLLETVTMCLLTALVSGQRLSNSFILAEGDVAHFIIASVYCFYVLKGFSSPYRRNRIKHVWKMLRFVLTAAFFTSIIGLQMLGDSWVKRNTVDRAWYDLHVTRSASDLRNALLSAFVLLPWICHRTLTQTNMNSMRACVTIISVSVGLRIFMLAGPGSRAIWRFIGSELSGIFLYALDCFLPWITYCASFIALSIPAPVAPAFHHLRYTVQGATHYLAWALINIYTLSLGERGALWDSLVFIQYASLVYASLDSSHSSISADARTESSLLFAWQVSTSQLFFASGHCCTFDCLQFSSAFIGFKFFHFYLMGVLLACNTWAGDILASITLPGVVVMYWSDEGNGGEESVFRFDLALAHASIFYTTFRLAVLILTVTFVAFQRNHLMAFAVFTPKFVFEAIGQCIGDAILILCIFVCSVSLKRWNAHTYTRCTYVRNK